MRAYRYLLSALALAVTAGCICYLLSLLRWLRFLAAVSVPWQRAERRDIRDFVLWMRGADNPERQHHGSVIAGSVNPVTGKPTLSGGYAPATINHALSAARMFYDHHLLTGDAPGGEPGAGRARPRRRAGVLASQPD